MIRKAKLAGLFLVFLGVLSISQTYAFEKKSQPIYKGETRAGGTAGCCIPLYIEDGFYGGAGFGYDTFAIGQHAAVAGSGGSSITLNPNLAVKGWNNGELFAGYGQFFNQYYFGGEIFVNSSSAAASYGIGTNITHINTHIAVKESLGASLLPGLRLNRLTLLYGRLGYIRTYFKIQESGISSLGGFATLSTQWANGLQFGLGLQTAIFPHTSLRGEYTYASYGRFKSNLGMPITSSDNQFIISLIYHFAF